MHNAGIKWFVVVWPTVLTSCTVEIPGLDDKAMLVEYNVLEVPVTKQTLLIKNMPLLRFKDKRLNPSGNVLSIHVTGILHVGYLF